MFSLLFVRIMSVMFVVTYCRGCMNSGLFLRNCLCKATKRFMVGHVVGRLEFLWLRSEWVVSCVWV